MGERDAIMCDWTGENFENDTFHAFELYAGANRPVVTAEITLKYCMVPGLGELHLGLAFWDETQNYPDTPQRHPGVFHKVTGLQRLVHGRLRTGCRSGA